MSYDTTLIVVSLFIGLIALLLITAGLLWSFRWRRNQGFYLKDFERISTDARTLNIETMRVRKDVEWDPTAGPEAKLANFALLNAAGEWDTGLHIALAAWAEAMKADHGPLDVEAGNGRSRLTFKARKNHREYIISVMRMRCLGGLEQRKDISKGLQRIHQDIIARFAKSTHSRK